MKKASKILLLIAGILAIALFVLFISLSAFYFYYSSPEGRETLIFGLERGIITSYYTGTTEEIADKMQARYFVLGIIFIFLALGNLLVIPTAFIARVKKNKILYILCIILGALGNPPSIVGGILGVVSITKEKEETIENNINS